MLGPDALYEIDPSMVGEDFCHFAAGAPGCMGLLGVRNEACGAVYGQYHSSYTVDEDALSGRVAHVRADRHRPCGPLRGQAPPVRWEVELMLPLR